MLYPLLILAALATSAPLSADSAPRGNTATAPATRPAINATQLPDDWPPLPDFKTPVDYGAWYNQYLNGHITRDGRPLLNELQDPPDDADEAAQARHRRLWAEDEQGRIPGMLTDWRWEGGIGPWDPADHPDWEAAYQQQLREGLMDKLAALAEFPEISMPFTPSDLQKWIQDYQKMGTLPPGYVDPGIHKGELPCTLNLLPSLATNRLCVHIIIQNAWRAPEGRIDPQAMVEHLQIATALSRQIGTRSYIHKLVTWATYQRIYSHIRIAMHLNILDRQHTAQLQQLLRELDHDPHQTSLLMLDEAAVILEWLQFCYLGENGRTISTKPNLDYVRRLQQFFTLTYQINKDNMLPPLDLIDGIGKVDPELAVTQFTQLRETLAALQASQPWPTVHYEAERLLKDFSESEDKHIVLREYVRSSARYYPQKLVLALRSEAQRRATHLLVGWHTAGLLNPTDMPMGMRLPRLDPILYIDPFSEKPFCTRLINGQFTLYSVADNGRDDGGRHHCRWGDQSKDNPNEWLPYDYVLWPPQPEGHVDPLPTTTAAAP